MKEQENMVPLPDSGVQILTENLVYAVTCQRMDGTKYLVLHPAEIYYDEKTYSFPTSDSEIIELVE